MFHPDIISLPDGGKARSKGPQDGWRNATREWPARRWTFGPGVWAAGRRKCAFTFRSDSQASAVRRWELFVTVTESGPSFVEDARIPQPAQPRSPEALLVLDTNELRWFAPGPLPADVGAWFSGSLGVSEKRCDTYLLDGRGDIGVKRRSRQTLELKVRQSLDGRIEIGEGLAGSLEVWRKWSPAEGLVDGGSDGRWVDVCKSIVKRRFSTDGTEIAFSGRAADRRGMRCRSRRGHGRRRQVVDLRVRGVRPARDPTGRSGRVVAGVGGRHTMPGAVRSPHRSSDGLPGMVGAHGLAGSAQWVGATSSGTISLTSTSYINVPAVGTCRFRSSPHLRTSRDVSAMYQFGEHGAVLTCPDRVGLCGHHPGQITT